MSTYEEKKSSLFLKGKLKGVSATVKFTSVIRKLVENRTWLKKIVDDVRAEKEGTKTHEEFLDFEGDLITLKDKLLLLSNPRERQPSDIKNLANKLGYMMPFFKYPQSFTEELTKDATLIGYEKGKVIFKAHDESIGAYFVLSGVIEVYPVGVYDPMMDLCKFIINDKHLYEDMTQAKNQTVKQGEMLGRKEILFGEKRERTAVVQEDVVLIYFDKKYLLKSLKPIYTRWHKVYTHLLKYEALHHFSVDVMRELSKTGIIVEYRPRNIVDVTVNTNFLIEGQVAVIQRLLVQKHVKKGKATTRLYHNQNANYYNDSVDPVYMQVFILSKGAFFGLGESNSNRVFWTNNCCKFIQFNRDDLVEYGSRGIWEGLRLFLEALYPTPQKLFNCFLYSRAWLRYKKELTNQVKRSSRLCTIHDVPIPIRAEHTKVRRTFMKKVNMLKMSDYLNGGIGPVEDELEYQFELDRYGDRREAFFGKYKTDPYSKEVEEEEFEEEKRLRYDPYPSFFFYKGGEEYM